jgi:hypothetical protein
MSIDNKRFSLDDENIEEANQEEQDLQEKRASFEQDDSEDNGLDPALLEQDKEELVDFLKYPKEKRKMTNFMEDVYKTIEMESVDRTMNRVAHEHQSELEGATPWHKPGHIGPLMYEYLNMIGVESAYVSGLQHTKSSMTKTIQQRVDEINTLLRGVGGFNRQIKASFARSAVIYLEQEDPNNTHRERVIFSINLGDFELRYPLDENSAEEVVEDGRTLRRLVWDEAVNTLSEIVSNTGMKPKYVKNDKNSCRFEMKQYLLSEHDTHPDEFFAFELKYINEETKDILVSQYNSVITKYNKKINKCKRKVEGAFASESRKRKFIERAILLEKERDFFIATNPDPSELDCGLVFSINVNTMKDYTITKDKMQVIMTKYILALSSIAVDKSMDQQVNTVYQHGQKKPTNFQTLEQQVATKKPPTVTKKSMQVNKKAS